MQRHSIVKGMPQRGFLQKILQVSSKSVKQSVASLSNIARGVKLAMNRGREDYIADIAAVLANIMLVGKEKTIRCQNYDSSSGFCTVLKFDVQIHTLHMINVNGVWRVRIDKHPEICAVCPYWRSRIS